jgi:hypothetical protein
MTYFRNDGELFPDAHPAPIYAYEYLKHLGFPLTELSYKYATEETNMCRKLKTWESINALYKEYSIEIGNRIQGML